MGRPLPFPIRDFRSISLLLGLVGTAEVPLFTSPLSLRESPLPESREEFFLSFRFAFALRRASWMALLDVDNQLPLASLLTFLVKTALTPFSSSPELVKSLRSSAPVGIEIKRDHKRSCKIKLGSCESTQTNLPLPHEGVPLPYIRYSWWGIKRWCVCVCVFHQPTGFAFSQASQSAAMFYSRKSSSQQNRPTTEIPQVPSKGKNESYYPCGSAVNLCPDMLVVNGSSSCPAPLHSRTVGKQWRYG